MRTVAIYYSLAPVHLSSNPLLLSSPPVFWARPVSHGSKGSLWANDGFVLSAPIRPKGRTLMSTEIGKGERHGILLSPPEEPCAHLCWSLPRAAEESSLQLLNARNITNLVVYYLCLWPDLLRSFGKVHCKSQKTAFITNVVISIHFFVFNSTMPVAGERPSEIHQKYHRLLSPSHRYHCWVSLLAETQQVALPNELPTAFWTPGSHLLLLRHSGSW